MVLVIGNFQSYLGQDSWFQDWVLTSLCDDVLSCIPDIYASRFNSAERAE